MTTGNLQVLIETSVWVTYLRRRSYLVREVVAQLSSSGRAVTCGVVLTELISGESEPDMQTRVLAALDGLQYLESSHETWLRAGRIGAQLRAHGASIPVPDLLIAALAMQHGCALYTLDAHFQGIPDLTLYSP